MTLTLWHYTTGQAIHSILTAARIKPTGIGIAPGEKPIVWFSTEQFWEPTVVKGYREPDGKIVQLGMKGILDRGFGLFRIGVAPSTAPYRWAELKENSGMPQVHARRLVQLAKQWGANPSRWRGSLETVHSESWTAFEQFDGQQWCPAEGAVSQ